MIPCPSCGECLEPSQSHCSSCKGPRLLVRAEGDSRPACAFHPDRVASSACSRCGGFACAVCLAEAEDGSPICRGCRTATRAERLPWDDPAQRLPGAFARSVWRLAFRPAAALAGANPEGRLGGSLLFAALAPQPLLACHVAALFAYLRFGDDSSFDASLCATLAVMLAAALAVSTAGWILLLPALDWTVLRLMGARPRGYRSHVRAAALSLAPMALGLVPVIGPVVLPFWCLKLKANAYRDFDRTTLAEAAVGAVSGIVLLCALGLGLGLDAWLASWF